MPLTGKQKRFLRAQANRLRPEFHVGKNGVTSTFIQQVDDSLARHELIKINLLQNAEATMEQVVLALEEALPGITVAQKIGRVILLYRPADKEKYQRLSRRIATL